MQPTLKTGFGLAVLFGVLIVGVNYAQSPSSGQTPSEDFTIRTTSRLVLLDVSVKDTNGGFVSGLTKDSFHVTEDGKPQTITQFADSDIPVTIGLVIDESGSMRRKKPEVITAALAFASESNPNDEMFVLNFNEKVRRGLPDTTLFTDNVQDLRAALNRGTPEGRTALYDAVVSGLKQLEMGRKDKKTLILISDGGDNVSSANMHDVINMARETVATIYTIGIWDPDDPDKNPDLLKRLAAISGGECYIPSKLEDIVPDCRRIAKDIRTRYTIGYIPEVSGGKKIRHIKVTATAPNRGKLVVRTRTEYAMNELESVDRSK
jgi:VWFA-related protein